MAVSEKDFIQLFRSTKSGHTQKLHRYETNMFKIPL